MKDKIFNPPPPKYAMVGNTEMVWLENSQEYYRHAGIWRISIKEWNGRFVTKPIVGMPHTFMWEVKEITEEEWRKANEPYIDNSNCREKDYL
jgi:hypothetical protein